MNDVDLLVVGYTRRTAKSTCSAASQSPVGDHTVNVDSVSELVFGLARRRRGDDDWTNPDVSKVRRELLDELGPAVSLGRIRAEAERHGQRRRRNGAVHRWIAVYVGLESNTVRLAQMRRRILVLNQYYRPGIEATAQLLADLCEDLAKEFDVLVVTSRPRGEDHLPAKEVLGGVTVYRTRSTRFDRTKIGPRAANYITYLGESAIRALAIGKVDLVVCMTDPPIVGDVAVAVARRNRAPLLVISEDVFPEVATELGRLTNPVAVGALSRLVTFYLRRADAIVAIGSVMRERLIAKGAEPLRVSVISNWVDTAEIQPEPRDNEWAAANDLVSKFVVMHSGNVGHAHDLDNLIVATTYLRDLDDLVVPIIGAGARLAAVRELAERLAADHVTFLPYQPREVLGQSLGAAAIHYVGLARGLSGFVVPSRVYGILSAGRPMIVAADADSETAAIVTENECGVLIPPGEPARLAEAIRDAHDGRLDLERMGARGREYVQRVADRSVSIQRYRALIEQLIAA
jgi:colanic acid biosynthesis glycosyl transferase WcaI